MSGLVSGLVGIQTQAAQPAVLAYNSTTDDDVTGNGAEVTVDFDTEIYDQGSDFANDTFTAPVTGRYLFLVNIRGEGITTSGTEVETVVVTTNRSYYSYIDSSVYGAGNRLTTYLSGIADMDAGETLVVKVIYSGEGSNVVDITGASSMRTYISVQLLV
jgi:hypothetical protein